MGGFDQDDSEPDSIYPSWFWFVVVVLILCVLTWIIVPSYFGYQSYQADKFCESQGYRSQSSLNRIGYVEEDMIQCCGKPNDHIIDMSICEIFKYG